MQFDDWIKSLNEVWNCKMSELTQALFLLNEIDENKALNYSILKDKD